MENYWQLVSSVPVWTWSTIAFIYGAIVGSFLNVCIHRIPRKEEIVRTPSHCPHCNEQIAWYHNIPIVSWIVLRGKAACCGAAISARYALVELLTAALSAYIYFQFGFTIQALGYWIFTCFLIVLMFIDWEHMRLPNVLTLPGAVIGLLFALLGNYIGILDSVIGLVVGAGGFFLIALLYKSVRGMHGLGMGDVKLMAMIGAFLGWKLTLLVVILGSVLGLIYGIYAMIKTHGGGQTRIPYGVFLGMAAIIVLLWGQNLLDWYIGFFPAGF